MLSDDDDDENDDSGMKRSSKQLGDDVEDEDDERHLRMLEGITGMPTTAFEGNILSKLFLVHNQIIKFK